MKECFNNKIIKFYHKNLKYCRKAIKVKIQYKMVQIINKIEIKKINL
jgi:hypothetical protein